MWTTGKKKSFHDAGLVLIRPVLNMKSAKIIVPLGVVEYTTLGALTIATSTSFIASGGLMLVVTVRENSLLPWGGLVIGLIVLFGISGVFSGLAAMAISPFGGFILLLSSIAGVIVGVVFSRIAAEFILIVFRINEHLGAIRDQGQGH